jgi:hypothetical protein
MEKQNTEINKIWRYKKCKSNGQVKCKPISETKYENIKKRLKDCKDKDKTWFTTRDESGKKTVKTVYIIKEQYITETINKLKNDDKKYNSNVLVYVTGKNPNDKKKYGAKKVMYKVLKENYDDKRPKGRANNKLIFEPGTAGGALTRLGFELRFKCKYCDKMFISKSERKIHLGEKHPDEPPLRNSSKKN